MERRHFLRLMALTAAAVGAIIAPGALAQSLGLDKPTRIVVPFGAGGITDVVARLVGQGLSTKLGQTVIIENRPGAGGSIAAQVVASAEPDGNTLLLGTVGTQVVNRMIYPRLTYDPAALVPISLVSNSPYVLAVQQSLGIETLSALIAAAKEKPGKLNFGSAGHGSSPHLGIELFKLLTGTDIVHIPFRSGGDAVNSALSGEVQVVFDAIPVIMPQVTGGRLKALAIAQATRSGSAPDVPTTEEQGLKALQIGSWNALLAPVGTPQPRLDRLASALGEVLTDPAVRARFQTLGIDAMPPGAEAYRRHVEAETARWSQVVSAARIKVE